MANPFDTFKTYAFRLELLQEYRVQEEYELFQNFKQEKSLNMQNDMLMEWQNVIRDAEARGARMSRVHVVDLPLSDYLNFEKKFYLLNEKVGEEIRLLARKDFENLRPAVNFDYWLFDDAIVLRMKYDVRGAFIGSEQVTGDISKFIGLKNLLLEKSMPLRLFDKNNS